MERIWLSMFVRYAHLILICTACSTASKFELTEGSYDFRQEGQPFKKIDLLIDANDSIHIFEQSTPVAIKIGLPQYLRLKTFDLDALAVPFKYRPGSSLLPRQLTTDFNGNIYLGYRIDRIKLTYQNTPLGSRQRVNEIALSAGVFGGLGTTFISPWTVTDPAFADEYNGFIISRGLAFLVGVNNLTFGVGVGWDFLTDRDKDIWIYQNKPWYGLTIGLNVN